MHSPVMGSADWLSPSSSSINRLISEHSTNGCRVHSANKLRGKNTQGGVTYRSWKRF